MHLSYCTNVHPAEDVDGVVAQLATYAGPVREAAGLDVLGVGLWLPAQVAHRLDTTPTDLDRLRGALADHGLEVRTLNAFPYGGFHSAVVGRSVYRPTWAERARLQYTQACARVLAALLPGGAAGSISTLPLAWRAPWTPADDDESARALAGLSRDLRELADRTGHVVRIAVEPEPGCVLDTVDDVVRWLAARTDAGLAPEQRIDPEHVGVCLDACHLAVSFADPAGAAGRVADAGLRVVKVQASAALQVDDPGQEASRAAVARFAEPRYLHQVRERTPSGTVLAADDLDEALGTARGRPGLPGTGPWRVHFHVPLHARPAPPLASTTGVLREAVAAVHATPHGREAHLDVETYTWTVLPAGVAGLGDEPGGLVAGIAAELRWARENLTADEEVAA
ncbi:metabolite traffic protein EboE [Myceligenerans indicum]|uniref:Metabolite traffic protein EboE n=1 Tax=Myceligenerans indicum TaxID=2593663 RepID=A0ABS1LN71_9MICO|nr:metabolite traffic protein EboE [Myceligenerans indicum]MBL0887671.1 metabolite traffic protein EboE [Myceligenerans indicum]